MKHFTILEMNWRGKSTVFCLSHLKKFREIRFVISFSCFISNLNPPALILSQTKAY